MNTTTKAFGISIAFHALMALFALLMLNAFHPPVQSFALPMKHITLVSLSQTSEILTPLAQPTPHTKTAKVIPKTVPKESPVTPQKVSPIPQQIHATQTVAPSQSAPTVEAKPAPAAPTATPAQSPIKAQPKADISAEKQSFFAHLRTKIQQNLRYPSAARRRGMEGDINVRFVLDNTGSIRDVNIRSGEPIFHNAAKLAVASASGVKIPAVLSETLPAEIDLSLEFRLD